MENPNSQNANFQNPNLGVLSNGSEEVVASKRTTRSQIGGMKNPNKQAITTNIDVHVSFKKGDNKLGNKGVR